MLKTVVLAVVCIVGAALAVEEKFNVADKKLTPTGSMPVVGLGTWQVCIFIFFILIRARVFVIELS